MKKFFKLFGFLLAAAAFFACDDGGDSNSDCVIMVTTNNAAWGTVSAEGPKMQQGTGGTVKVTAKVGDKIRILATEKEGYLFTGWSDGANDSYNMQREILVLESITLTAMFATADDEKVTLMLYSADAKMGSVGGVNVKDGTELTVGDGHASGYIDLGNGPVSVNIFAVPADGYVFSHWSDGNTEENRIISLVKKTRLTAYFVKEGERTVKIDFDAKFIQGEISVTSNATASGGWYPITRDGNEATTITATATAKSGFVFDYWDWNGVTTAIYEGDTNLVFDPEANPLTFSLEDALFSDGGTLTAKFTQIRGLAIGLALEVPQSDGSKELVDDENCGTVETTCDSPSNPEQLEPGIYFVGDVVKVTVTANDGYVFDRWEGDGVTDENKTHNPIEITIDEKPMALLAIFKKEPVLKVSANEDRGSVACAPYYPDGKYPEGTTVEVTATANDGFVFDHWEGFGVTDENKGSNPISITIVEDEMTLTAFFVPLRSLTVSADESQGSVSCEPASAAADGKYPEGTTVEVTATANDGFVFDHWEGDGVTDENKGSNPISIAIGESDMALTAIFTEFN